jgi:PHD/YefM family antitoxin component YafN of YafNO toxin-antitoxin module
MSRQLKQVINLSKKTGDRIVVFDNDKPEDSFVVMPLEQYEGLMDKSLTDKKILAKMNSNDTTIDNSSKNSNNWKIPREIEEESEE